MTGKEAFKIVPAERNEEHVADVQKVLNGEMTVDAYVAKWGRVAIERYPQDIKSK
jgi:hypothetical protein